MRCVILNVMFVALVFVQAGCRSVYRFQCTSRPSGAVILVGEEVVGQTGCTVKIPRKSDAIQDHRIEMTFCLPDGREKRHIVDLRGLKPSNPFAETVGAPFMLLGAGLILLSGGSHEDEDEDTFSDTDHKKDSSDHRMGLLGLGTLGAGAGLLHLFGGDFDSLSGYPIHVDFNEPPGAIENEETHVQ